MAVEGGHGSTVKALLKPAKIMPVAWDEPLEEPQEEKKEEGESSVALGGRVKTLKAPPPTRTPMPSKGPPKPKPVELPTVLDNEEDEEDDLPLIQVVQEQVVVVPPLAPPEEVPQAEVAPTLTEDALKAANEERDREDQNERPASARSHQSQASAASRATATSVAGSAVSRAPSNVSKASKATTAQLSVPRGQGGRRRAESKAAPVQVEVPGQGRVKGYSLPPAVVALLKSQPPRGAQGLLVQARRLRRALPRETPPAISLNSLSSALAEANSDGRAPLAVAAMKNKPKMVALLLSLKAAVDAQDSEGNTALMLAVASSQQPNVELLLTAGAKMEILNKGRKSVVDVAEGTSMKHFIQFHFARYMIERVDPTRSLSQSQSAVTLPEATEVTEDAPKRIRLRLDHLPNKHPAEMIEARIRQLLRKPGFGGDAKIQVAVHPITQRPQGYAYVDFTDAAKADAWTVAVKEQLSGSPVKVVREDSFLT